MQQERLTSPETAGIVIIGNEILSGRVADANGPFLARELDLLGIDLLIVLTVPDEIGAISWAVREARSRADLVLTSGGIGPTHDDLTSLGVADALDLPIERNAKLAQAIRSYLAESTPEEAVEAALRMADLPKDSELTDETGDSFPVAIASNVVILPGIPSVLQEKWNLLKERFRRQPKTKAALHMKLSEHRIADRLRRVAADYPTVSIGSYPDLDRKDYRVKVTLTGRDPNEVKQAIEDLRSLFDQDELATPTG